MLWLGGSTQILEAAIWQAEDYLAAELLMHYPRCLCFQNIVDNLVAAFDEFAESRAKSM